MEDQFRDAEYFVTLMSDWIRSFEIKGAEDMTHAERVIAVLSYSAIMKFALKHGGDDFCIQDGMLSVQAKDQEIDSYTWEGGLIGIHRFRRGCGILRKAGALKTVREISHVDASGNKVITRLSRPVHTVPFNEEFFS